MNINDRKIRDSQTVSAFLLSSGWGWGSGPFDPQYPFVRQMCPSHELYSHFRLPSAPRSSIPMTCLSWTSGWPSTSGTGKEVTRTNGSRWMVETKIIEYQFVIPVHQFGISVWDIGLKYQFGISVWDISLGLKIKKGSCKTAVLTRCWDNTYSRQVSITWSCLCPWKNKKIRIVNSHINWTWCDAMSSAIGIISWNRLQID